MRIVRRASAVSEDCPLSNRMCTPDGVAVVKEFSRAALELFELPAENVLVKRLHGFRIYPGA